MGAIDDPEVLEREKSKKTLRSQDEFDSWKGLINNKYGRHVLYDIMQECGIDDDISDTTHEAYRLLGKRSIGLYIKRRILTIDPQFVILMDKEAKERIQNNNF